MCTSGESKKNTKINVNFVTLNYEDFEPFLDHPKTTFFETEKKLKFGREWPELSGTVQNRFGKAHP